MTDDVRTVHALSRCDDVLATLERKILAGAGESLSTDQLIQLAGVYAQRALLEPPPFAGLGEEVAAFLRGIDPKELERVVLERDDLHGGLTGPMLDQLALWAEGR